MMIGKTILHYKILETLGKGGMGIVYKAEDLTLGRTVALKFLSDYPLADEEDRARFEREARAAASLNHPNICTIYEFHQTEEFAFIAMEYIEGETLKQILKRDGPFPQEKATEIIIAIAEALAEAHKKGIIHRDIKSDNIMITKNGAVKVMDFGLAKLKDAPTITKSKSPMGTIGYMSPELIQEKNFDHRTDLWSLGVVFFEMLTGELPFRGDTDVGIMNSILGHSLLRFFDLGIDSSLQYVISTLLEKNPDFRYSNAGETVIDLTRNIQKPQAKLFYRKIRKNSKKIALVFFVSVLSFILSYNFIQKQLNKPPWLKRYLKPVRLISEPGPTKGGISADGKYVAYSGKERKLYIKNIETNEIIVVPDTALGPHETPAWSPSGRQVAYTSVDYNVISVYDLDENSIKIIEGRNTGDLYNLNWSPDGNWIVSWWADAFENTPSTSIVISNINKNESEVLLTRKMPQMVTHPTWFSDSKHIFYYDFDIEKKSKIIRSIDIETGRISNDIYEVGYKNYVWWGVGLCCSPDGRHLVFPEYVENNVELVALPLNKKGNEKIGKPIPVTNLSGMGVPFWPYFSRDGKLLSYGVSLNNQDIVIQSFDAEKAFSSGKFITVANRKDRFEFDAVWSPDGKQIAFLYSKGQFRPRHFPEDAGSTEIQIWDRKSDTYRSLSAPFGDKSELSFLPDMSFLSYLSEKMLWKIPLSGGSIQKIYPKGEKIEIYSYAWGNDSNDLYAIIRQSDERNKLVKVNLISHQIEIIEEHILNADYAEVRYSAASEKLALRDVCPENPDSAFIKVYNTRTGEKNIISRHLNFRPQGQISWTPDGSHILYGSFDIGSRFFYNHVVSMDGVDRIIEGLSFDGQKITGEPGYISPEGDEFFVYMGNADMDIWMVGNRK